MIGSRITRVVLGLLLAAVPAGAGAQERLTVSINPGTQVRIETSRAPGERLTGRVARSTADSLSLVPRRASELLSFAFPEIVSLEVRGGDDRRRGVLIGAAIGAGLAVVFGGLDAAQGEISPGEVVTVAMGNALIGGLIGYAFAPAGWQRVPLLSSPRPAALPPQGDPAPRN